MEVKHFKLVSTIAEAGSLTRAADKLFLTQSALSHQLKEIEQQLKTKLFDRINKKLILTGAGNILLKSSRVILAEIEKSRKEIGRFVHGEAGEIRLSTQCYTCYHWLPPIIKKYQVDHPNMEVNIETGIASEPVEELLSGKLDVAIVYDRIISKHIEYFELFTDELVAVVPPDNPLSMKGTANARDFANQQMITVVPEFDQSRFYRDFLEPKGVVPKKVTYVQLTESVIEMVKAGMGVTVMASWLMKPYRMGSSLKTIRLGSRGLRYKWYLALRKTDLKQEYMESFVNQLKLDIYP